MSRPVIGKSGDASLWARALALSGAGIAGLGAAVVALFEPSTSSFFPACPLLTYTGFACPGCGLTRGFHALFHGDVVTALDYNALIPLWAGIFGYLAVAGIIFGVTGRSLKLGVLRPGWLFTLLGLLIGFGIVRNIPVYPLTLLFP